MTQEASSFPPNRQTLTELYWKLSFEWNSRMNTGLTITDAIRGCNTILSQTNPHSPLARATYELSGALVHYGRKPVKQPTQSV